MAFISYEEKEISKEKGKRLVYYFLTDEDGNKFLVAVGKEKSLRHMTYNMTNKFHAMMTATATSWTAATLQWKSRRDLISWLSLIVSDNILSGSLPTCSKFSYDKNAVPTFVSISKYASPMEHISKDFSWLGAAWNCKKKRMHYRSFRRNGITISVHDFVYVMSEDHKRLVAYVEDLYENIKLKKMAAVQWFHKVDEFDIILPPDTNEREIFSSSVHQDINIECIDGLASVLCEQDFDKFQNIARFKNNHWNPYLCKRIMDNGSTKAFDITQVQGYWSQEVLRSMYATTSRGSPLKLKLRIRNANKSDTPLLLRKGLLKQKFEAMQKYLAKGCFVEVLSQDSGIRGCWFRCLILKKHHDKVKVQYQDVRNADDNGTIEEWVLTSRIASPDKSGIRYGGRPMIRPEPPCDSMSSCCLNVGSIVDARWHDGWWEGIVLGKASEAKFHVYFPGEQKVSTFEPSNLRQSREWVGNRWNDLKDNVEFASALLPDIDIQDTSKPTVESPKICISESPKTCNLESPKICNIESSEICNLKWKWTSSKKRKRTKGCSKGSSSSSSQEVQEAISNNACEKFTGPEINSMLAGPTMVLCSNLVMSQ